MNKNNTFFRMLAFLVAFFLISSCSNTKKNARITQDFGKNWKFALGDFPEAKNTGFDDNSWRKLNVPHDWSIEGEFSPDHPATVGGGALPGGIGWYRKTFTLPENYQEKNVYVHFDGIYMNSEVWVNGNYLGKRPNGYISFRYDVTPYIHSGEQENNIAVKVDNSQQPNSRWYSGSGIYRNVWLVTTGKIHINNWGTYVTTPVVNDDYAEIKLETMVNNSTDLAAYVLIKSIVYDTEGKVVAKTESNEDLMQETEHNIEQTFQINSPRLWSVKDPYLYTIRTEIEHDGNIVDNYETPLGIRTFNFDREKGFHLNGEKLKINGVCNHHDLGCLGSAVNKRAIERQLEILKEMGVNAIRTAHNPPAPELLDLCDKMGFIVMDEMFDMWKKNKSEFDYSLYWDEWRKEDLKSFILRDRKHPSVLMWSIGNEILEQWDSSGINIATELAGIVRELDDTRLITTGNNDPQPSNFIIRSGMLDLIGYNYHHELFEGFMKDFPVQKFIATETVSSLHTRGMYDMPSDSVRIWPVRWDIPFENGNPDNTCSSYDNCHVPWGSSHMETWRLIKKHDYLSGQFIWTGFDYLGEPTPYQWPSRSSYFGIIDLAGFPKDVYYMYQSEWTAKDVLHIFPHWNFPDVKENFKEGDSIDVWAYTNCDKVELFINDISQGEKQKTDDDLHVWWRVAYTPGTLKAVGTKSDGRTLTKEIKTAGKPAKILLSADRQKIKADARDLSFVTISILDKDGNLVPFADNLVNFEITGPGFIAGVDNGLQTSHEPFKANYRKAFSGLCLAVIQSTDESGEITLEATSEGLEGNTIKIASN